MSEQVTVDPITLEVIGYSLRAIAEELETNLTRTSFSPLIYEYQDYAVGIVAADGSLISQGTGGLPIFLADIGAPLASVLDAHPPATLRPGDAIVTNDPDASGQHLNNVTMYTPVFSDERLIAFVAVRTHWSDVGGRVLGSCLVSDSTDIFQEGITLPALKILRGGELDEQVLRLIERNCRVPEMVMGDMQAQLAACRLGEERFSALLARYGWHTIQAVIAETWQRSERVARARVAALPDGEYDVECWLDDDGIHRGQRVRFPIRMVIDGERVLVDMSDIAAQLDGPYNTGRLGGVTAAKVAFKYAVIPDLPADEGCFRPIEVVLPPGRFLSAGPTAPRARWNVPMSSVIDVIVRAFGAAGGEVGAAGHHAAQNSLQFVGKRPDGTVWQHHDTAHAGWGATAGGDGSGPFKTMSHGDCRDIPAEIVEALYPVRLETVGLREDSAGLGRFRGGLGMRRIYTTLADCRFTVAMERTTCPPWGIAGGEDGRPGEVLVQYPDGTERRVLKETGLELPAGSRVTILTAGGGGWGPASERTPQARGSDENEGYVSAA